MDISRFLKSTIENAGRALELFLTGQSGYRITTNEFETNDIIEDIVIAKRILESVKLNLDEKYNIKIRQPIVIELIKEDKIRNYAFTWFEGSLGKYKSQDMIDEKYHMIYIQSGLKKERFKAILAHELAHAYQHEAGMPRTSKALREGMARWVEYKVLLQEGEKNEAFKLLKIKNWLYGKGISRILELEKKTGEKDLIRSLLTTGDNDRLS